jgi:glycosyltransferase involved in cell wall biosynthesis
MRILMMNDVGTLHAGAEIMINHLRKGLRAQGHQVRVLAGSEPSGGALMADERYCSFVDGSPWQAPLYVLNPSAVWRLWRNLRKFKPDIVHLHNVTKASPFIFWLLRKHTTVFTAHDHTLLDPTRFDAVPTLHPYADTFEDYFISKPSVRFYAEKLRYALYRRWCPAVDRVLACSHFYACCITESGVFDGRHVTVVPNGIDLPPARPFTNWHRLLYVGRLDPSKGVDVVVAALPAVLRQHPGTRLDIVGDGEAREALRQQAAELGVHQAVRFLGRRTQAELHDELYPAATVIVVPSVFADNFPTVCLEGLAAGRPIVGTRVGGIPEIIQPGTTGALVPPGEAKALAVAISNLLSMDKTQLRAMSARCRKRAEQEYSAQVYVSRTLAQYLTLTSTATAQQSAASSK